MPITILKYLALAVAGIATGQLLSDSLAKGSDTPAYFQGPASALTPFMILSCAILLIAIAYAVRSLVLSVKICKHERDTPQDYYH